MSDTPRIDTEMLEDMQEAGVVVLLPELAELPDNMGGKLLKAGDLLTLGKRRGKTPDEQAAIDLAVTESTVFSASDA